MTAEASPTRILFIGNSYTTRNNLPRLIVGLAADAEHSRVVEVETISAGGASLRRHWNAGVAQEALAKGKWDSVVLQEQSTLPVKNRARYHDNVRLFAAEAASHRLPVALYLTWSRQQAPQVQPLITSAVEDIAAEVGATVVAVGPAWHTAMREDPSLMLYTDDGSHPTPAGSYLAACVFLVALFGERPIGSSVSDALKLDCATAERLQAIAWASRGRS